MRVGIIYTQYIAHSLGWFPAYSKKVPVRYMNIHDICNKYIHGSSSSQSLGLMGNARYI